MTSNVGARQMTSAHPLGFAGEEAGDEARQERVRRAVREELKKTFRPEFLNRIDDTIIFRQLGEEDLEEIARRMLKESGARMAELGLQLRAGDEAVARLARECRDPAHGARPLRRALRQKVEDAVAEGLLSGRFQKGDRLLLTVYKMDIAIEKEMG